MDAAPPAGAARCLARAADAVRDDPIGILLPAGGLLFAQAMGIVGARSAWDFGWVEWVGVLVGASAVTAIASAFLRSRWIAVAARNAGWPVSPWGRPLALLGVQLVVWPLAAVAAGGIALPLVALGAWLAGRGLFAAGAVVGAAGICGGSAAAIAVRSVFALAAPEVVVGGSSAVRALGISARRGLREILPLAILVVAGDLATTVGGAVCGAGALPGYPITDLAVLHRWRHSGGTIR